VALASINIGRGGLDLGIIDICRSVVLAVRFIEASDFDINTVYQDSARQVTLAGNFDINRNFGRGK